MTKGSDPPNSVELASTYRVPAELLDVWLKDLIGAEEDRRLLVMWAERARAHGEPVALVGAGMSLNAVPRPGRRTPEGRSVRAWTWKDLENELKDALGDAAREGSDPLWLAQLYREAFGPSALMDVVRRAAPTEALDPGPAHAELVGIPWHTILTTNYDDLIERSWTQPIAPTRRVWTDQQLAQRSRRRWEPDVIHLHGVLDDPESIILTLESYRRYPKTNPGMVAKTRQLFMEHPLLMIGFSATDPNFVQWMGWVDDVLQGFGPLHVNLFVTPEGASPSTPRRRYWHDRVRFVPCKPDHLTNILSHLGKFLRGIPKPVGHELPAEFVAYLQGASSPKDALARLQVVWGVDPHRQREHEVRMAHIEQVCRRLIELREADSEVQALLSWLRRTQAYKWPTPEGSAPPVAPAVELPLDRLRSAIRDCVGDCWPDLLDLVVIDLWQGRFSLLGVEFDHEQEARALKSSDTRRPSLLGQTPWRQILASIRIAKEWPESEVSNCIADYGPLTAEQGRKLHDLRSLKFLRTTHFPEPPNSPTSAQDHRRVGYIAVLREDGKAAWEHYRTAAELTGAEDEAPDVQWATAASAKIAARWYTWFEVDTTSQIAQDLDHWTRVEHDLRARWGPEIARRADRQAAAPTRHVVKSWEARALPATLQPGGIIAGDLGDGAQELVDWAEEGWMHPAWASNAAAVCGSALWRHAVMHDLSLDNGISARKEAVRMWRRYGSELLVHAVHEIVDFGDPDAEESWELMEALLARGRWIDEWVHGGRALALLAPALPRSAAEDLDRWANDCEAAHNAAASRRPKGFRGVPHTAARVWMAAVRLKEPGVAVARISQLCNAHPWMTSIDAFKPSSFPWKDWVVGGKVSSADAIATLSRLLASEDRTLSLSRAGLGTLIALVGLPGWESDEGARAAVEARLARHDTTDAAHAIVALHETTEAAGKRGAEAATQLLDSTSGLPHHLLVDLIHLHEHLDLDRKSALLSLVLQSLPDLPSPDTQAAWPAETNPSAPDDPNAIRAAELVHLAALLCRDAVHESGKIDLAPTIQAWRRVVLNQPEHLHRLAGHGNAPTSWFDESIEALFDDLLRGRLPRTRPTADDDRLSALTVLAAWAYHGEDLAWRRLPALSLLRRHRDARLTADVVRVVGRLAINPNVAATDRPWDRWAEFMLTAADDRRVLVRMAVAWTVARARKDIPEVSEVVATLTADLQKDDRAGIHAALQGWC